MTLVLTILSLPVLYGQSYMKHEIEDEKQYDFPGISIEGHKATELYSINLDDNDRPQYKFDKTVQLEKGKTLKISSYIIAKEVMDGLNFNSLSAKTDRKKLKTLLDSKNDKEIVSFLLQLAEKHRPPKDQKELQQLTQLINNKKTEDDPAATPYFKTGMVEVRPLDDSDVRYFVPLEKLKESSMDVQKGKVTLLQSLTLLSFKKIRSNLNFGYLSENDTTMLSEMEQELTSTCNEDCALKKEASLSELVLDVIDLAQKDFLEDLTDARKINENVLFAEACLVHSYVETCGKKNLIRQLDKLLKRDFIKAKLAQHSGSLEKACKGNFR